MAQLQVTDGFTQNPTNGDIFDGSFSVERFDPDDGDLFGIELALNTTLFTSGALFADPFVGVATANVTADSLFVLDPDETGPLGVSPSASISLDSGPVFVNSFGPTPVALSGSGESGIVPIANLAPFVGEGAVEVPYSFFSGTLPTGFGLLGAVPESFVNDNGAFLTLTYSFIASGTEQTGTAASETLAGAAGDDTLLGGAGDDTLTGLAGNDRLDGGAGNDRLEGGDGNDAMLGRDGNDLLDGGDGDDNLAAAAGNDVLRGGDGNDSLGGGDGNDDLSGGAGNDVMGGGTGNDIVAGNAGRDDMSGGYGRDLVRGGGGDDTLAGSFGADTVEGGQGDDSVGGGAAADRILGGAGNDAIGAGDGDDTLFGESGNDFMGGGAGDDLLKGGGGADTLNGGAGNDTLEGAAGADVFVFNAFRGGETDRILDFEDAVDRLRLDGVPGGFDGLDIAARGDDAVIGIGSFRIVLDDVSVAQIDAADFVFT